MFAGLGSVPVLSAELSTMHMLRLSGFCYGVLDRENCAVLAGRVA